MIYFRGGIELRIWKNIVQFRQKSFLPINPENDYAIQYQSCKARATNANASSDGVKPSSHDKSSLAKSSDNKNCSRSNAHPSAKSGDHKHNRLR